MKSAIKHNYLVLKYQFLFDSVEKLTKMPSQEYVVQLPEVRTVLTKEKPVQKKHFGQHKTMSSFVKKSRKYKLCLSKRKTGRKPVNIAVFYALKKRKEMMSCRQKVTFKEREIGKFMTNWKYLPRNHPDRIASELSFHQYNRSIESAPQKNLVPSAYRKLIVNF